MIRNIYKYSLFSKQDHDFYLVWIGKRNTWEVAYFNNTDDLLSLDLLDGRKGAIMEHILEYTDHSKKIYVVDTEEELEQLIGVKPWIA